MILGHIPAVWVVNRLLYKRALAPVLIFVLAYLPDLLDKIPSAVLSLPTSGYAHSVFVGLLVSFVCFALAHAFRWQSPASIAKMVLLFYLLHLGCDNLSLRALLWPVNLKGVFFFGAPIGEHFDVWASVVHYYILRGDPVLLGAEVTLFIIMGWLMLQDTRLKHLRARRSKMSESPQNWRT
jgi:hypothetical protein